MQHVGVGEHDVRARADRRRAPPAACRRRRSRGAARECAARSGCAPGPGRAPWSDTGRAPAPGGRTASTCSTGRLKQSDLPLAVPVVTIVWPRRITLSQASAWWEKSESMPRAHRAPPARRGGARPGSAPRTACWRGLVRRARRAARPRRRAARRARGPSQVCAPSVCNSRGAMTFALQGHLRSVRATTGSSRAPTGTTQFADLDSLARRKRELGVAVSLVLPAREVAGTIGAILDEIHALNESAPLVDQVVVVDAGSADGTRRVAARHGAEVFDEAELMPAFGPVRRQGRRDVARALGRARRPGRCSLDADTANFGRHFVYGMLGPLLCRARRALREGDLPPALHGAGRHGRGRRGPRDRADREAALRHLLPGALRLRAAARGRGGRAPRPAALDPVLHRLRGRDRR